MNRRLIASTNYLAKNPQPQDPRDLVDWDWLALSPVQNIPLEFRHADGRQITIKPSARLSTNNAKALYSLARADAGLANVPEFLAEEDITKGEMAYVLPEWALKEIVIFAEWPANAPKHGLIHLALSALSDGP